MNGSQRSAMDVSGAANPFAMPTDEQVFVLRDQEKRKQRIERERVKHRKVHEKTTWSTRIGSATSKSRLMEDSEANLTWPSGKLDLTTGSGRHDSVGRNRAGSASGKFAGGASLTNPLNGTGTSGGGVDAATAKEKEDMVDFIAKKREMGLTRMSLATKRHEIRKLDEEVEQAEKKIKQQEEQLLETIQKFEDFLKDNDMKAVDAMKKAEQETKGKQEKTAEIKKLTAHITSIKNDKLKHEEHMQNCLKYKKFLDQLTPLAWFRLTLCNIEIQRVREDLVRQMEDTLARSGLDPDSAAATTQRAQAQADLEKRLEDQRSYLMQRLEELVDTAVLKEVNVLDPDMVPMYFAEPERILAIFMEIEENNLFLIQNCQETEESLEELKSKFNESKQQMDAQAANLKAQIEQTKQKIAVEEAKKKQLSARSAGASDGKNNKELLEQIDAKVAQIFKETGFGDGEASFSTIGMLTKIEAKLEELRTQIMQLPTEFVSTAMKHRDKDRRQKARQKLLDEQRRSREERSRKALARSQAPVRKKVGKPVMWRSKPLDKKKAEEARSETDDSDLDDSEFFS